MSLAGGADEAFYSERPSTAKAAKATAASSYMVKLDASGVRDTPGRGRT
jgi:hypothetical protein